MGQRKILYNDLYIGTNSKDKEHIYISFTISKTEKEMDDIFHRKVPKGADEISFQAVKLRANRISPEEALKQSDRYFISGGQIVDSLDKIDKFAGKLSSKDIKRIKEIWSEYHLNAAQAGCAHQDKLPEGKTGSWGLDNIKPCNETGYRYGRSWLYKELPKNLPNEVVDILKKALI